MPVPQVAPPAKADVYAAGFDTSFDPVNAARNVGSGAVPAAPSKGQGQ